MTYTDDRIAAAHQKPVRLTPAQARLLRRCAINPQGYRPWTRDIRSMEILKRKGLVREGELTLGGRMWVLTQAGQELL
jgi:hypothetical protein